MPDSAPSPSSSAMSPAGPTCPSIRADEELASLATFLHQAKALIDADTQSGRDYGGFLAAFGGHIEDLQERVSQAQGAGEWHGLLDGEEAQQSISVWEPVHLVSSNESQDSPSILGPGKHDSFKVEGDVTGGRDLIEHVDVYDKLSKTIAKAEHQVTLAFKLDKDDAEITKFGKSSKDIVQEHIALLKQYNDLKDVGQQLIGVIAENREVRVGSLYDDDEFGVGPDD